VKWLHSYIQALRIPYIIPLVKNLMDWHDVCNKDSGVSNMKDYKDKQGGETGKFEPHHYVERPSLGSFFEPQGAFDGRLLYKDNKVTYIFYDVTDAISIHFDKGRNEIFYKGHHANNMTLGEAEWLHLEKFRQAIKMDPTAHSSYLAEYESALEALERANP